MIAIVISIILGLIVNECSDVCPWCARKLVRWSAYRRYTDPARAATRAEELSALIDDRPGKLLKLFSALGFVGSALLVVCRRGLARRLDPDTRRAVRAQRDFRELRAMLDKMTEQRVSVARGSLGETWSDLYPNGRHIYYEGRDPEGFAKQIQDEFGFNPALDPDWGVPVPEDWAEDEDDLGLLHGFHCPATLLDVIYGDSRFPMGT
jgi:hypothetical protein